jgi:cyclophilin family peptidyl-prolyl cis-trans isomerase
MTQHSRPRGGGGGRRPKDVRRGPGRASPPPTRSAVKPTGVGRRRGGGSGNDPRVIAAVLIVAALVFAALFFSGVIGGGGASASPSPGASTSANGCPTSQPAALAAGQTRTVTLKTGKGDIVIKVNGAWSPIAAGNFVALASCGFYDGLTFHRTASLQDGTPFVIQGGDPKGDGSGGPGYSIQDEPVTQTYKRGTVAMARSSAPNSQGSQFFIVLSAAAAGPLAQANTYAIFGEVTSGMDVADAIYNASPGSDNVPNPVKMGTVTVANP